MRQQLVDIHPHDSESRRMLANSYMNLSLLEEEQGDWSASQAACRRAEQLRQAILADDPGHAMTRRDLGRGAYNQAKLCEKMAGPQPDLSDPLIGQARQFLRQALAIFQQLLEEDPHDMSNQYGLALSYRKLADFEPDYQTALSLYQQALDWMDRLALRNPDVPDYQADMAAIRTNLGIRHTKAGDLEAATDNISAALEVLEKLVDQYPSAHRYQCDFAVSLQEMALIKSDRGELRATRQYLQSAIAVFEKLVAQVPEHEDYALGLAGAKELLSFLPPQSDPPPGDQ